MNKEITLKEVGIVALIGFTIVVISFLIRLWELS